MHGGFGRSGLGQSGWSRRGLSDGDSSQGGLNIGGLGHGGEWEGRIRLQDAFSHLCDRFEKSLSPVLISRCGLSYAIVGTCLQMPANLFKVGGDFVR